MTRTTGRHAGLGTAAQGRTVGQRGVRAWRRQRVFIVRSPLQPGPGGVNRAAVAPGRVRARRRRARLGAAGARRNRAPPRRNGTAAGRSVASMTALADATLEATFQPDAGLFGATLRHRGADVLSPLGIPLLHPWANRLSAAHYTAAGRTGGVPDAGFVARDDHGLAIHGLRQPPGAWTVDEHGSTRLRARLHHPQDAARFAAFPFPHRVDVDAALDGPTLTLTTTLHATGDVPVPVAFGLHPYLRLPGVPPRGWQVTLPAMRREALDLDQVPTGAARPQAPWAGHLGNRAWDDAFTDVADGAAFVLTGGGRRVTVTFDAGFGVAQVFARAAPTWCASSP